MTPPVAHHMAEDSLVSLLLVGGGTFSFVVAIGRTRLAATRASLARRLRPSRERAGG
jgi:hypothetical protein